MIQRSTESEAAAQRARSARVVETSAAARRSRPAEGRHAVQFYQGPAGASAAVCDFLAEGLVAAEPVLVIATAEHGEAFARALRARRLDLERASRAGRLVFVDSRALLARFMGRRLPDEARFQEVVGALLRARVAGGGRVRVYGDMVHVLWQEGKAEAAERLEALWNELGRRYPISLLCAYDLGSFHSAAHSAAFERICALHGEVIPAEPLAHTSGRARQAEVARLQQRARALESEIAERKLLEQRLREALRACKSAEEGLEEAAAERERLLAAEQAARAEAEAASRAKSEFLAVMSHELRTPLNAIAGYVDLVRMGIYGPVTEAQGTALARVQRSQRHLISLINDVLSFARIEGGRLRYVLEDVELRPALEEVLALVEPLLTARQLRCQALVCPPRLAVRADRERLHQILINLLTNATKYTPAGGSLALAVEGDHTTAAIHVQDTGIGIPAEKLESIFDPFVQLGRGLGAASDGVGLGLAISRDLARGMGGDLTVHSEPGTGTTFTITLPTA